MSETPEDYLRRVSLNGARIFVEWPDGIQKEIVFKPKIVTEPKYAIHHIDPTGGDNPENIRIVPISENFKPPKMMCELCHRAPVAESDDDWDLCADCRRWYGD